METLLAITSIMFFPAGISLILGGMLYEWADRKLVARFQNRIGPRWFQPLADTIKLLSKEEIEPLGVNRALFFGLPVLALAGALTAALYVPIFGLRPAHSFPGDLIVTLYLLSLLTMCTGLAGWNSASRFSIVGATRTLTQLFAYEAPFLLALLGPAMAADSWQISKIVSKAGKAKGVRIVDANTLETIEYYAKIVFLNASCLASNQILLNSTSNRFPNGLGNDNGILGHYVAFHNYRGHVYADIDGFEDKYYFGRRPTSGFMPRYQNVHKQETDFLRGYLVAMSAARGGWGSAAGEEGFGAAWKEANAKPGPWHLSVQIQAETIPKFENHVRLSQDKKDKYGIPQLITSVGYDNNDEKMLKHFWETNVEMLTKAGCKNIRTIDTKQSPGLDIHEMGGIRMGADPKTSLVNKWNQLHACKNVFVTDGAAMTSISTQNPSLTFMAFTARAANHAVAELKKKNL